VRPGLTGALGRHLAGRVAGWTGLTLALLLGLAMLAGAVEGVRYGLGRAGTLATLEALPLVVPLVPLACALGAGLAAARLRAHGEAVALEASGLAPARVALVAAVVGLGVGALGLLVHDAVVPAAAERALALRAELGEGGDVGGWLWTEGGLVRVADGRNVPVDGGHVGAAGPPAPVDGALLRRARALRSPAVASPADLAGDAPPLRVERMQRSGRVLACALLAGLAWLGPRPRGARVLPALALGIGFQALALATGALAAGGQLPAWAGALGPTGLVLGLLLLRLGADGSRPAWALSPPRP